MSESHDTPPEDFNFGGREFELSRGDKTQLDLLDTQAEYLHHLTTFANFPYDSASYGQNRRQLVSLADDMYRLLHERVKQIVHEQRKSHNMPPGIPISGLISHLDARQIEYFNEHHPAYISAQQLSPGQVERRYDIISSLPGMDLPRAVILAHAKRTHQHLGHYLLGRSVYEWYPAWHPPAL